jgi:CDP-diacylglycerol--serine O-phosphatidyltransferase
VTLYFWSLHEMHSAGWIAAMVFAIAAGLRLARFNVMIDDPNRPSWAGNFFVGLPAPAGACTVLLPVYLHFLGMPSPAFAVPLTVAYTLAIAFLMVSRLPVFSGKKVGKRVPPDILLPVFVSVVLVFALLIAYPWPVLTIGAILYLASLPFGWMAYRDYVRRDAEAIAQAQGHAPVQAQAETNVQGVEPPEGRFDAAGDATAPPPYPPPQAGEGREGGPAPGGHGAILPFERGGDRPTNR